MNLIDDSAVAEKLSIPTKTLAQWRYLGKGPRYIKVGRHVRYRPEDVETWIDQQTRGDQPA